MLTDTAKATITFAFNGTGASIVGAMRFNHGLYSVNIDGMETLNMNGHSLAPLFNQTLYANNDMDLGPHTLILSNQQDAAHLDVDYVSFNILEKLIRSLSESLGYGRDPNRKQYRKFNRQCLARYPPFYLVYTCLLVIHAKSCEYLLRVVWTVSALSLRVGWMIFNTNSSGTNDSSAIMTMSFQVS